ncbi:2-oxoacid:ferredoxin oxidoreductase subunit alpha [Desulfosporosinus youngiae]|uniref:2-oxoacid:ferredoxin oxidoreductase, alpha subunit n=1 Tax=Desulfosporosinus youngiae DSM 17734 TaxID=768710 RepID=H5Y148_9FIRM|nr:2-oxoacid:ferredoxin oxidoreductase subunit alpha [Desulfosporosinus youngiae]EHQ87268.1 2-oxoacid:ferredoxin oxidoreductase, alpha subunit [Desulfosporosinus youngiae DSM 17734]
MEVKKPIEGEKRAFMTGNEVCAWAALAAQADIMYGYPITPQNEVMHYWTRLAPKFDKKFLQTEDELSAGFTTLGGVLSGAKAFTATGGPGNVLMQEPISMAEAMRIPTVMVIQQRGGPSTATVIYSQQEVNLTTYGGNGEGHRIVYSTATHQDLFDYTIKAFNMAWKYRFPTFVLGDGYQAKMRESLMIYDPESRGIKMVQPEPLVGQPGMPGVDRDPSLLRNTYNTEEELYEVIKQYQQDYDEMTPQITEHEEFDCGDAEIIVLTHGIVSRSAKVAVRELRAEGIKAGYFRPVTLRPFPVQALQKALDGAKRIFLAESAEGQFYRLVTQSIYGQTVPIETLFKPGVGITSEEIVEKLKTTV